MNIFTPEEIRLIENKIVEDLNINTDLLMEHAAYSVFNFIEKNFCKKKISILCGPGNNGEDGFALGRILNANNYEVEIYTDLELVSKKSNNNFLRAKHLKILNLENFYPLENSVIIDALFGIGLSRRLDNKYVEIIKLVNSINANIISIDIPSGLNPLTGEILTEAIKANYTITFFGYKLGMIKFPASSYLGEVIVSTLTVNSKFLEKNSSIFINTPIAMATKSRLMHKTTYGRTISIAGSNNYYGAPFFTAKSALLSGSGYSILITSNDIKQTCAVLAPEVIYKEFEEIEKTISERDIIAIGPGLGLSQESKELFQKTLNLQPKLFIIDADGLNILSEDITMLSKINKPVILTPHVGEMARLLNTTVKDIEVDPIKNSKILSSKTNSYVILKGVHTIISTPKQEIYVNLESSNTLATAGSGDVLTGILVGVLTNEEVINGCRIAVHVHGTIGKILEDRVGSRGNTALDIMNTIPKALNAYNLLF
ncbi:MAG: NAD(P)H-hydrate dehydratase [Spirochaetales bacterium]|nr:NAD(P)H-hydrate dehydratase [Spirochaetales bacterium]